MMIRPTLTGVAIVLGMAACSSKTTDQQLPAEAGLLPTPIQEEPSRKEMLNLCKEVSQLASTIMDARQSGVVMSQAMDVAEAADDEQLRDMSRKLVVAAYREGSYQSPDNVRRVVRDFENQAYLECVQSIDHRR